jgi:hypothetical protein
MREHAFDMRKHWLGDARRRSIVRFCVDWFAMTVNEKATAAAFADPADLTRRGAQ